MLPYPPTPARLAEHVSDWCVANLTGYARRVLQSIAVSIDPASSARHVVPAHAVES
jgi:hypothetical protein